jgi:RNA-splicing ligase RtcB
MKNNVIKISGRFNTAICYTKVIEDEAIAQIKRMCDYEMTCGSNIRIMPDVHAGKGCTIGTTMTITDKIVPNVVGVDIGCGMYTVKFDEENLDLKKVDEIVHSIPSGMNVWNEYQEEFDFTKLICFKNLKSLEYLKRSLGTLGGGNHFIEIDESADKTKYLVIHSGSRNLGKQVAEHYQHLAIALNKDDADYQKKRNEIIQSYKIQGRKEEISDALKTLHWQYKNKEKIPEDLCYLEGEAFKNYLHDIKICQKFAIRNREKMAEIFLEKLSIKPIETFHTIHNYIDVDEMILRKGAIAAHKGEKVLIPINARDGSILAIGKGIPEWNFSAPHGAGRIMSRVKAKKNLNLNDFKAAMNGIYTTSVNENTLDEAPMAYKSLDDILDVVKSTVDVIEVLRPIYNFKSDAKGKIS